MVPRSLAPPLVAVLVSACLAEATGLFGHRLDLSPDAVTFDALGDTLWVAAVQYGHAGSRLPSPAVTYASSDPSVVAVDSFGLLTSRQNGTARITARAASGDADSILVTVLQVPDTIVASLVGPGPIVSLDLQSVIPLSCRVLDRNGFEILTTPQVLASSAGRWIGTQCHDLRLQRSGVETLEIKAGPATTRLELPLAVRPTVSAALGVYLEVDGIPAQLRLWAPTLRRTSRGDIEVYFTGYEPDSLHPSVFRGHLHRAVSNDGIAFRYDGIALQRGDSLCSLDGSGIENVVIAPRAEGQGWRMFYAGGSFGCYGWQVFSAVSTDERTWVKEPGVRLSNGGTVPPAAPQTPPWPVGEGMVLDPLQSGEWRMFTGGYRHLQSPEDKFQIVEWRSPNQLAWTYVGPVFTTDELPAGGQRSVYSPTTREFTPGLWRMIVTADDLNVPGGRSRLWSAVSTDEIHWQLEGELMSAENNDFLYSTMVDETLVFLRHEAGQAWRLATAIVSMP